jgi:hypothetical protein
MILIGTVHTVPECLKPEEQLTALLEEYAPKSISVEFPGNYTPAQISDYTNQVHLCIGYAIDNERTLTSAQKEVVRESLLHYQYEWRACSSYASRNRIPLRLVDQSKLLTQPMLLAAQVLKRFNRRHAIMRWDTMEELKISVIRDMQKACDGNKYAQPLSYDTKTSLNERDLVMARNIRKHGSSVHVSGLAHVFHPADDTYTPLHVRVADITAERINLVQYCMTPMMKSQPVQIPSDHLPQAL